MNNLEKRQFYQHVRNIATHAISQSTSCATVTETIVQLWSDHVCPGLQARDLKFSKTTAKNPRVLTFLNWLYEKPMLEAAFWLSSAYALWVGDERRKSYAMYFTPPALTTRLLEELENAGVSFLHSSFLDPACGGAAFLAPIAERMKKALKADGKTPRQILDHVEQKLFGADLDKTLCLISRQFLRAVLSDEIQATQYEPSFKVVHANSLLEIRSMYGQMDVVVSNPPYRKLTAPEMSRYKTDFGEITEGQPNLYGLFIALCVQFLRKDGVAALLTPTSFMSGQNFAKLRTWLMKQSEVLHIGIVSDRSGVFIYVEQETALTIIRRSPPSIGVHGMQSEVAVVSRDGTYKSVGICALPNSGAAWPIPRAEGDAKLIDTASRSKYRLSDYGYKARSGAFVWNRDQRNTFFSLKEARRVTSGVTVPLLWSSDVRRENSVRFLDRKKKNGEPAFVEIGDRDHSSIVKRSAVLLQRVTSNDQPRRLIAASASAETFKRYGGFVGENHLVILEAIAHTPKVSLDVLVKLLGSKPIDRYFRCISGATNVSLFELAQLPLPCPTRLNLAIEGGLGIDEAVSHAFDIGSEGQEP
jgi:adenine-specific DNA-methyltransferase